MCAALNAAAYGRPASPSDAAHRSVLDQHAIVTVTDAKGTILEANDLFCEISGYAREELVGNDHRLVRSGHHTAEFFREMYRTIGNGCTWHGEICNRNKTGELYWVRTTIAPILGDDRKPWRYIAIRTEITERVQAESATAAALARTQAIIDTSADATLLTDKTGQVLHANRAFGALVNTSVEELQGHGVEERINAAAMMIVDSDDFVAVVRQLLPSSTVEEDYRLQLTDGRLLSRSSMPMLVGGKPAGRIWNYRDITAHAEAERLARGEAQRAQRSSALKGQFLANMSHEIRTPMNGVIGMLDLLLGSELTPSQRRDAALARESAASLLTIVDDVLDFSKVDAGKLDLDAIDFDPAELFGNTIKAMGITAKDKGIELVVDCSSTHGRWVVGDAGRLRQIVTNLVSNAIKFTSSGEVVAHFALDDADDGQVRLLGTVTDTGPGIAATQRSAVFKPFTQADETTTRRFGGTGLGLAIVSQLCELMGGNVSVLSSDSGSCFSFEVRLQASDTPSLPVQDVTGQRFLVVDRNAACRAALRAQLEVWGVTVLEASSAAQAQVLLEDPERTIDTAVVDVETVDDPSSLLGAHGGGNGSCPRRLVSMGPINGGTGAGDMTKPVSRDDLRRVLWDAPAQAPAQAAPPAVATLNPGRILLVEDNRVNQLVATRLLRELGCRDVDVAADGVEALAMLTSPGEQPSYALILMDCQMQVMDGYEATRRIRLGEGGKAYVGIPIIALTANAFTANEERCREAGMTGFVTKPVDAETLFSALRVVLGP